MIERSCMRLNVKHKVIYTDLKSFPIVGSHKHKVVEKFGKLHRQFLLV